MLVEQFDIPYSSKIYQNRPSPGVNPLLCTTNRHGSDFRQFSFGMPCGSLAK